MVGAPRPALVGGGPLVLPLLCCCAQPAAGLRQTFSAVLSPGANDAAAGGSRTGVDTVGTDWQDGAVAAAAAVGTVRAMEAPWPTAATLPIVLASGLCAFVAGGKVGPYMPAAFLPYAVCSIYVIFSIAIDVSIAVEKRPNAHGQLNGYAFNPVCAVLVIEVIKFWISFFIYLMAPQKGRSATFIPAELSWTDTKWLTLPAVIFTASNILVFEAIGKNDMSAFGVFRDTILLWTAAFWKLVFRTQLGWLRIVGILLVFAGLAMNKMFAAARSHEWSWMFLWVLAMTLCNAAGSVANEFALKHNRNLDINIQNMVLYSLCTVCSLAFLAASDPSRLHGTFFTGFDDFTWLTIGLQSFVGLLVSRLLKYTDAVMKTIATCLRGPMVLIVSPAFTHVGLSAPALLSALVVASGCLAYAAQGPLNTSVRRQELQYQKNCGSTANSSKPGAAPGEKQRSASART